MTTGYSGSVVLLARQVVIVATVLALSGSQAVLSACLALCSGSHSAAVVTHHGSAEAQSVVASAAEHQGHHPTPAAPDSTEAAVPLAGHDSAPELKALCGSCCPDSAATLVAGPRAERADAIALAIAPTTLSWQLPASIGRTVPSLGPPVSPQPPIGALIPLRI